MTRLEREATTINAMIKLYCADLHKSPERLCDECASLRDYALLRVEKCRFGAEKPACAKCTVHCYKRDMRERVRAVMRYSGPRMLLRHPLLAIYHLMDSARSGKAQRVAS